MVLLGELNGAVQSLNRLTIPVNSVILKVYSHCNKETNTQPDAQNENKKTGR